jgi:hypothetical protein
MTLIPTLDKVENSGPLFSPFLNWVSIKLDVQETQIKDAQHWAAGIVRLFIHPNQAVPIVQKYMLIIY